MHCNAFVKVKNAEVVEEVAEIVHTTKTEKKESKTCCMDGSSKKQWEGHSCPRSTERSESRSKNMLVPLGHERRQRISTKPNGNAADDDDKTTTKDFVSLKSGRPRQQKESVR